MYVKYKGHTPSFIYEWNGKRYLFTNQQNLVDIPPEALRALYHSNTANALDVIPVENEEVEKLIKENTELKEKIKNFEIGDIGAKEQAKEPVFFKRGRGRPRKV